MKKETNEQFKLAFGLATNNGYALAIKHFEERMSKGESVFEAIESMKDIHRKQAENLVNQE